MQPAAAPFLDYTAGKRITAAQTESLTKRGGTIVIVGNVMGDTPMNFYKIAHKELVIKTVHRCRNVFPLAVRAISDKRIDISRIAADCFAFDDGIQAFEKSLKNKQTVVKAILKMESSLRPAYTSPFVCAGLLP